jgi:hypothetical protein
VQIRKILCPIDLSTDRTNQIGQAVSFAQNNKAELIFLYVMRFAVRDSAFSAEPGPFLSGILGPTFSVNDFRRTTILKLENHIFANLERLVRGLSWKVVIRFGNIAREVVNVAVAEKA